MQSGYLVSVEETRGSVAFWMGSRAVRAVKER